MSLAENTIYQDYIITSFVAEFINTITNLIYGWALCFFGSSKLIQRIFTTHLVFYAYHGLRNNNRGSYINIDSFPYLSLGCVGFGSAVFHGTVKLQGQWCAQSLF